ncbi:hypothetical protein KBB76_00135 [Candidatus Saccharibacteria bacterium]|nr:hypothetical protein [Candidatus Saccharibacteria bacterium]HOR23143.1 ATP cone domain-containing protein [Candidatus Saccharibacteria bacterium]HPW48291.1 ATP cone domain-containing protein [Candidatus Saccharibacteria bacterium]
MKSVIKLNGQRQAFDKQKLHKSIYTACLSVQDSEAQSIKFADEVVKQVESWINTKSEVTTKDIREEAGKHLRKINGHAGYLYLHHRII